MLLDPVFRARDLVQSLSHRQLRGPMLRYGEPAFPRLQLPPSRDRHGRIAALHDTSLHQDVTRDRCRHERNDPAGDHDPDDHDDVPCRYRSPFLHGRRIIVPVRRFCGSCRCFRSPLDRIIWDEPVCGGQLSTRQHHTDRRVTAIRIPKCSSQNGVYCVARRWHDRQVWYTRRRLRAVMDIFLKTETEKTVTPVI